MQPVIYDVAVSADGFISGVSDDVSRFPHDGPIVDDYVDRLGAYSCCIMGRRIYEFAYAFGLKPGENPYPALNTVVFSRSISLPKNSDVAVVADDILGCIKGLRQSSGGPIYLCGGGNLAGWLAARGAIDRLRIKRAPIFLGAGTRLFGQHALPVEATHMVTKNHAGGVVFQEFDLTGG